MMGTVRQTRIFKALSALLTYPSVELHDALAEIRLEINRDQVLLDLHKSALRALIDDLASQDIYDLQERYLLLFDRTRSLSLHLFEHVHGESRDRGQAMIDLLDLYRKGNLAFTASELPDYLPAFLEYCSTLPRDAAIAALAQVVHILTVLTERLRKRGSPYAAVFSSLCRLVAIQPSQDELDAVLSIPEADPQDFAALDQTWEEEAVTFGPGQNDNGACGTDALIAKIRHGRRAMPPIPTDGVPLSQSPAHSVRHQGERS